MEEGPPVTGNCHRGQAKRNEVGKRAMAIACCGVLGGWQVCPDFKTLQPLGARPHAGWCDRAARRPIPGCWVAARYKTR